LLPHFATICEGSSALISIAFVRVRDEEAEKWLAEKTVERRGK